MASKIRASHRNPVLTPGVHRFGRSKMYHKRGLFVKKSISVDKKEKVKREQYKEKAIGGAQNGGKRMVQVTKSKKYHPTATGKGRRVVKRPGVVRRTRLRGSLKPGTVVILLAGRHAGKRVVFLKQLETGLLLVTGPFKLNGVPLRRINQQFVIATSTRLDVSNVTLPPSMNDSYFRCDKKATMLARREQQGAIFASEKSRLYQPSTSRKADQATVDGQIMKEIKSHPEKKMLFNYMSSPFSLSSGQYPHQMKF